MFCIQFSNRSEAILFYQSVVSEQRLWLLKEFPDHVTVSLDREYMDRVTYDVSVDAIIHLFRSRKLPGWIEGILKHNYYYRDEQEIARILEIAHDFEDKPPNGLSLTTQIEHLRETIEEFIGGRTSVVFDDLSAACLLTIQENLIDHTGILIDEYKQEEAYQMLVDSWRYRVHHKDTGIQQLHLIERGGIAYFHDEGNPVSESETLLYIKQYPDESIRDLPLKWYITPALVHAPDQLVIYSDTKGDSKLQLLMNIFEERAIWKPLSAFPFEIS